MLCTEGWLYLPGDNEGPDVFGKNSRPIGDGDGRLGWVGGLPGGYLSPGVLEVPAVILSFLMVAGGRQI